MTLLKDVSDCSTYSVRGLDNQLIAQMNKISPGLLVRIDDLDASLGQAVHPWMQAAAKQCLKAAIAQCGKRMIINSAYRTLAGQALLRKHCENGTCGITAAAPPGKSNHNNASAIDIEDSHGWRNALESNAWQKLGDWDDMHFDCVSSKIESIGAIAVQAFQQLWNLANPDNKIAVDGGFGEKTNQCLQNSPAEGFGDLDIPRVMRLTSPVQSGEDIGRLQLALRAAGITLEKADQVFGAGTDVAVKQFQAKKGLVADGIVGEATREALGI